MISHREMANAIRFLAIDGVQKANSGHPGMPMGMADVATVLFSKFLKFDASDPHWFNRDRFVLSAGHGSMLLYSLLYLTGYKDITLEDLKNFRQLGSKTAGHPEYGHVEGVETTTGPLGQGIATAVGMALAERMLAVRFGEKIVDHHTYVICGDGCLMEGISEEAISLAGHLNLSKLIVLWDDNGITIDGSTSLATSTDQLKRFEASNWKTFRVDGHDPEEIAKVIAEAKDSDRPCFIACKTIIGYGSPNLAGTEKTHGSPLGEQEIDATRKLLGWEHAPFEVPEDIVEEWRKAGSRGKKEKDVWEKELAKLDASLKTEFLRMMSGELPENWQESITNFKQKCLADKPKVATRKASEMVLEAIVPAIPELIGGSADLTHSNLTKTKDMQPVRPGSYSGRYIHYGIREHGMAALMNGMALHKGFIPYGGAFFIFSDYMKPSMRLSALMKQRVIYVLTHDSIGLGEDGPTHQPIEQLAALRAVPNMLVMRPCDIVETAECWEIALQSKDRPSVLVLSRQNLPLLRDAIDENLSYKGAYEVRAASDKHDVTLIATGSEVELALKAKEILESKGVGASVVSMPSWELFAEQPLEYREKILGKGTYKVAVEALSTFGWERYADKVVGMNSFGASAPASELYKHFGITPEVVAEEAISGLKK
ncbi:MAG: transketolase [Alphaproteobacteria bacterium]